MLILWLPILRGIGNSAYQRHTSYSREASSLYHLLDVTAVFGSCWVLTSAELPHARHGSRCAWGNNHPCQAHTRPYTTSQRNPLQAECTSQNSPNLLQALCTNFTTILSVPRGKRVAFPLAFLSHSWGTVSPLYSHSRRKIVWVHLSVLVGYLF